MMFKLFKICVGALLSVALVVSVVVSDASIIRESVALARARGLYEQALQVARGRVVGEQPVKHGSGSVVRSVVDKDVERIESSADALRFPDVHSQDVVSEQERELRRAYGDPVAVQGGQQVFAVDSTHFVTLLSSDVKTFVDQQGIAQVVDTNLVARGSSSNPVFAPYASPVDVSLPSSVSRDDPIAVAYGGAKVRLAPESGVFANARVRDNAVLYNNVSGDDDVQFTVQQDGVKEDIVLASWSGKHRFSYVLQVDDYDVRLEHNQIRVYEHAESHDPLFVIAAPIMVDASGASSDAITLSMNRLGNQYHVTVDADASWLADSSRVFPVKVDPTVTVGRDRIVNTVTSSVHGRYEGRSYGYVGYMTACSIGMCGRWDVKDPGKTRMLLQINYDFAHSIPSEARIDSATLDLYEYTAPGFMGTQFAAYRLKQPLDIWSATWDSSVNVDREIAGAHAISGKRIGMHHFDIRETVNGWVHGLFNNYGLMVAAVNEQDDGGAFYTSLATASNAGQIGFTPDKAPSITVHWSVPDPVDIGYPIGNTTVVLRNMALVERSGKLAFQGVFADGVTTPGAQVSYQLSDAAKNYAGVVDASYSYKYPDSSSFMKAFPDGVTKYKDKWSNWQTMVPFTNPDLNTVYTIDASSVKDGVSSGTRSSDAFVIYRVTQYDTLPKIAAYYGVPLEQIAFDNRIQDMLVVKNNTLFIRNPSKHAHRPYNPSSLSDADKAQVDTLLMGRGLHCEFGFEPVNVNTGNFVLDRTDVSLADVGGPFAIERHYNAQLAGVNGLFGRGWSFAFNEQVSADDLGNLYYTRDDGSIVRFTKVGDTYQAPDGVDLSLRTTVVEQKKGIFASGEQEYPVLEYHISDTRGTERVFNYFGLLTSVRDEHGNTTTLTYDQHQRLTTITSPSGVQFGVTLTDNGQIAAIALPEGTTLWYEYDDQGRLVSYTDATGAMTRYEYDDHDRMTAWYDPLGNRMVANEYDERSRVIAQTDALGARSKLEYGDGQTVTTDANGHVTTYTVDKQYRTTGIAYPDGTHVARTYTDDNRLASERDEAGHTTRFTYDADGNRTGVLRFDGKQATSTYDEHHHMLSFTGFDGLTTVFSYDTAGSLATVTLPDGSITNYQTDKQGRILSVHDAAGHETQYSYDGALLTEIRNAAGGVTKFAYDAHHRVTGITNPLGATSSTAYDAEGRVVSQTDADGVATTYAYDAAGQVTAVRDGTGHATRFSYDAAGRKIAADNGDGGITHYSYDAVGNLTRVTDPEGHSSDTEFDSRNRIIANIQADGSRERLVRDVLGRVVARTDEAGRTSTLTYDDRSNQIASLTDAMGQRTTVSYDMSGRVHQVSYPVGTSTTTAYDKLGRVVSFTDEAGHRSTYQYDKSGNLVKQRQSGRVTSYSYDVLGNVLAVTDPEGHTTSYEYDAAGHAVRVTDPRGFVSSYQYSPAGRLTDSIDAKGGHTGISYDAAGREHEITDAAGFTTTVAYHGQGRASTLTDGLGNTTRLQYNQMEQLTQLTDPTGASTQYAYNALGLPERITDANGNVTTLSYTPTAQLGSITYADGTSVRNEYDALDRVIRQTQSSGLVTTFAYDAAGRVIAARDNQDLDEHYAYDAAGNRTSVVNSLGERTEYAYDQYGQCTSITYADGRKQSATYTPSGLLHTATDVMGHTTTYTYDAVGNLIRSADHDDRVSTYSYDALNRLTAERDAAGNSTRYAYDALGNLARVTDANGNTTNYGYDANQNLLMVTDPKNQSTVFTYDAADRVTQSVYATGAVEQYEYDAMGHTLRAIDGQGNATAYTYDVMGRVSSVTQPTGGVTQYQYDATGSMALVQDPSGDTTRYTNDYYGRLVTKVLADQSKYTYEYDRLGRIVLQRAPLGLSRAYSYDVSGNLTEVADQSHRITRYTYDAMGRVVSVENPLAQTTSYTYDTHGNMTSMTAPSGAVTRMSYTNLDQLQSLTSPTGRTQTFAYDRTGQLISRSTRGRPTTFAEATGRNLQQVQQNGFAAWQHQSVSERSRSREPSFDGADHQSDSRSGSLWDTSVSKHSNDGLNQRRAWDWDVASNSATDTSTGITKSITKDTVREHVEHFAYDANGNLTSYTNALGQQESYTYDALDRLSTVREPQGALTAYTYDHANALTQVRDATGALTTYSYDANGNLTRVQQGAQSSNYQYDQENHLIQATSGTGQSAVSASYEYDSVDNLTKVTDSNGHSVKYSYDQLSSVVQRVNALGQSEQYTYNIDHQLSRIRKADGHSIRYDYNTLDQLIAKHTTNSNGEQQAEGQVVYAYDPDGRRVSMSDITGTTRYAYDADGYITGIRQGDGSVIKYQYDDFGNISAMTYPNGDTVSYAYDALDRLTAITDMHGKRITYTYDTAGNVSDVQRGDGSSSSITYDQAHRVTSIMHKDKQRHLIAQYAYQYDGSGNIHRETITSNGVSRAQVYTYDSAGHITSMIVYDGVKPPDRKRFAWQSQSPDAAGAGAGGNDTGSDDADLSEAHEVTRFSYTYDRAGNRIASREQCNGTSTTTRYRYDANNRLTTLTNDSQQIRYSYDANGNRTKKVVRSLTGRSGNSRAHATRSQHTADHSDGDAGGEQSSSDSDGEADSSSDTANSDASDDDAHSDHADDTEVNDAHASDAPDAQHVEETVDYIYDTDNRLMAVRDHEGLLFAALYDGEDNRVFTASRTTATREYQLFTRKSPQTSAMGEGLSAFWYAFTQQVIQFASGFTTSAGFAWIDTFDAVAQAWHRHIAKDRASREGLVVHPPSADNLPGEQPVEYASQVQGPLIPYTTKTDTYHYFAVRNYVNDTNREFAQVLQTTDAQHDTRTSYVYGGEQRLAYYDEQSANPYQYLGDIRGSVTALMHDGQAVAMQHYLPYGQIDTPSDLMRTSDNGAHAPPSNSATNTSTVGVRNAQSAFAYTGEARDVTGLDYLRARYYDSEAGSFISEDSIQGNLTDAASWNRYAYVQNNPLNYTDPSGHLLRGLFNGIKHAASSAWNAVKRTASRAYSSVKTAASHAVSWVGSKVNQAVHWVGNKVSQAASWAGAQISRATSWAGSWATRQATSITRGVSRAASAASAYVRRQVQQARHTVVNRWQQAIASGQSAYQWGASKMREAANIARNWSAALEHTVRHVCETADRIRQDAVAYARNIDWKAVGITLAVVAVSTAATIATAGVAGPLIAGAVASAGLSGALATVATGVAVGAVVGAAGGATTGLASSVLTGKSAKETITNTVQGALNGAILGALSGGSSAGIKNLSALATTPLGQHTIQAVGNTVSDTATDAIQGKEITATSVGTNLLLNIVGTSGPGALHAGGLPRSNQPANATGEIPKHGPDGSIVFPSKRAAKRQAKRDAGVPVSRQPYKTIVKSMETSDGHKILDENWEEIKTRQEYYKSDRIVDPNATEIKQNKVVIQDHSAGHQFGAEGGEGDQPAHIHARPLENTRTGSIDGVQRHYYFENEE